MLFLHVLIFFTLGTFTVVAPVASAPVSKAGKLLTCMQKMWCAITSSPKSDFDAHTFQWRTVTTGSPENTDQLGQLKLFAERVTGYWYSESVSEYCSFSRLVCTHIP